MVAARLRTEHSMVASTGWWLQGAWAIMGAKLVRKAEGWWSEAHSRNHSMALGISGSSEEDEL